MRIEYTTACPECTKMGIQSTLAFDSESGKFTCNGETVHEMPEMPSDLAPEIPAEDSRSKPENQTAFSVPEPEMTADDIAALDKAMLEPPRPRDFGSMVSEGTDEVAIAPEAAGTQGEVLPEVTAEALAEMVGTGEIASPRVGLGEFIVLPNGDAICGVRIEEKWVSGLQSEAETQGKTSGEYFQETLSDSLIQWYSSVPGVR